jgi:glycosyltransferase involved in cell wall biosynthesis
MENKIEINSPLVSVFIPAYNVGKYIEEAIQSIIDQSYNKIEIVVLDDASTDDTLVVVKRLAEKEHRIKIFTNEVNLGLSKTRNKGLFYCTGDYIALLDADDKCDLFRIEKQLQFLIENPDYKAVSSWMQEFGIENPRLYKYKADFETLKCVSIFYNPISHAASMFEAKAIKEIGYDENYTYAEDAHMYLRFIKKFKASCLQETLYFYRRHTHQSISDKNSDSIERNEELLAEFIVGLYWNSKNSQDVTMYLQFVRNGISIKSAIDFLHWDNFMQKLYENNNANKFFETHKLINFVFKNYWQTEFQHYFIGFSFSELLAVFKSPFCVFTRMEKTKYLIKKAL